MVFLSLQSLEQGVKAEKVSLPEDKLLGQNVNSLFSGHALNRL